MDNLTQLIRPNIRSLSPYTSARDEFEGDASVWLDANENPFGTLNRYPDPYQQELKRLISEETRISTEQLFIGNGSDEVIDLIFRLFVKPGTDKALTFSPTYGMYQVSAAINDAELIEIPLDETFQINLEATLPFLDDPNLKVVFICSPNNPTGNLLRQNDIATLLKRFRGIVVIDEAYIDFAATPSWNKQLRDYPNLVVTQTFSKARGLAAARLGIAFANAEIIQWMNRIKPPYNVSSLNQKAGIDCLQNKDTYLNEVQRILSERARLITEFSALPIINCVYPTDANFILIEVENASKCYAQLTSKGIVVRNRSKLIPNTLRVSIGTESENNLLLNELKQLAT